MKHGSTTSLWSQINCQLSEQQQVKAVKSNQRHKHQQGILFIDYLEKGRTINREYYIIALIVRHQKMTKKKKVFFHEDNALCHKLIAMMAKLHELHFKLLPHPPYSPDLATRDYWLFADFKKYSRERDLAPMKK